ncbi:MAG TPA: tetratricopeptide repeat protein [Nitrososphaeraceae archaeon]|nr:tetratricopeptide repeat protein [Nitrososphaeraceae archaeon]
MYSRPEEHSITLPIVDPSSDTPQLPLVLNVLALYWGEDLSSHVTDEIKEQYKGVRGSVLIEGIELAEKKGFRSVMYKSSMKDIKKTIDEGIPVITILPGIHDLVQHATIVCGYEPQERRILTYVPEKDKQGAVPEKRFEQEWEEDDTTSIILIPSDMSEIISDRDFKFQNSNRSCLVSERLRLKGDIANAMKELTRAVDIDSDNPLAWYSLGSVYSDQKSESAIECYKKAIQLNQRFYLAYRALGNYYLVNEEFNVADEWYSRAIDINPVRFGPIYKNRALARLKSGKGSVKEDLKKYLQYMPGAADRISIQDAIKEL